MEIPLHYLHLESVQEQTPARDLELLNLIFFAGLISVTAEMCFLALLLFFLDSLSTKRTALLIPFLTFCSGAI